MVTTKVSWTYLALLSAINVMAHGATYFRWNRASSANVGLTILMAQQIAVPLAIRNISLKSTLMAYPSLLGLTVFLFSLIGQLSGSQYHLFRSTSATWEDAKSHCALHGRVLAKISSAEDQMWIENLSPYIESHFWIGLKKKDRAESFVWLDSTELEYTNWADGFPGYDEGVDCVRMRPNELKWETFNCSHEIQFLCEDIYYKRSPPVSEGTMARGLLMGFAAIGGLLILSCLMLQLPCCRYKVSEKIAHIGLGMRTPDFKPLM